MVRKGRVQFRDIAQCLNVHVFIIWEFLRRYDHMKEVSKDKYGRGSVSKRKCRIWINDLATYIGEQDFSYKQDINKRLYLFRDEARREAEKENGQDVERVYSVSPLGDIIRTTLFSNGGTQNWRWNVDTGTWNLYGELTF